MNSIQHKLFYYKNRLLRPAVRRTLDALSQATELSPSELKRLHHNRCKNILLHAYDSSDFYRNLYDASGFNRNDLSQKENFKFLPTLSREDIRNNFERIVSSKTRRTDLGISTTGGSTGIPLTIGTDQRHALEVISWRRLEYWGSSPSDASGYIYRVIPTGTSAIARGLYHYPTRRSYLSATAMNEHAMNRFAGELLSKNAQYLVSYVGALKIFGDYVRDAQIKFPSLRFIWSTAAPMPRYLREELENTFGCPIYTQYGSCEFYWIASERLDRTGLDVDWDIRKVEVVDTQYQDVGPEAYGELLVTDLLNYAFPLIRYRIGDRGRFLSGGNEAEDLFPKLDYVKGRVSDIIQLKNGKKIPGEFWTTIFDNYADQIAGFAIHQQQDYQIRISYKPAKTWSPEHETELRTTLDVICEATPYKLCLQETTSINNGKLQFVTSELK
jgi:phenylacetate-CoA ligase